MPSSDLILNVKQIAGYSPAASALPTDTILIQRGGLGGPYISMSAPAFVGTALAQGGNMSISGELDAQFIRAGSAAFSNANVNLLWAQKACVVDLEATYGSINGSPIITARDLTQVQTRLVWSFNGRSGAITLTLADLEQAGGAPIDSPNFTSTPTAPTAAIGTSTGQLATTAFVMNAVTASTTGVSTFNGRTGAVTLQTADISAAGGAVLNSPGFVGVPTGPTAGVGTSTTQLATCAFVLNQLTAIDSGVISFNGRSGAVTFIANDLSAVGGALLNSPSFVGTPSAPTAAPGNATTQIATTAFVMNALASQAAGVTSFNGRSGAITLTAADVSAAGGPYLPLTGGTLTGPLTGTAATFAGRVSFQDAAGQNNFWLGPVGAANVVNFGAGESIAGNPTSGSITLYPASATFTNNGNLQLNVAQPGGGQLTIGGNAYKPGGGSWVDSSDERIKTVLGDYTLGLDQVIQLHPVRYRYKGNDGAPGLEPRGGHLTDRRFVGLVAQEVEGVFPGMVTLADGWVDGQPVNDMRQLEVTELMFALVNAVKELALRLTALETRFA